ncbi:MAG: aspartate kinase [Firmicutes bacterium]|nr:aspartate kinase [Bacillota bacterium]
MGLIVQKFGGTSVGTPERIRAVARRIVETRRRGNGVVVVVSAMGKTTDQLIALSREVTDSPPEREYDMLLATGEQVSSALTAMAVHALGEPVVSLTGAQVGILTDGVHTKAKIMNVNRERMDKELEDGNILIVCGFQGINDTGDITTLGRGGSDTTAVALAAALQADVCEIYTDVDGVYTTDPRIVPEARKLPLISYDEMLELAQLGAKVLQPRSVEYGKLHDVVIHVRSSFNDEPGTIVKEVSDMERDFVVTGVASDKKVSKLAILDVPDRPGIAHRLFSALAEAHVGLDMIVQSVPAEERNHVMFTVAEDEVGKAITVLERVKKELGAGGITCEAKVAKVSIVGAGIAHNASIAARMFGALAEKGINIKIISTSEIKISCLIDRDQADQAIKAIHDAFELGGGNS